MAICYAGGVRYLGLLSLCVLAACGGGGTPANTSIELGDPNPGLPAAELAAFLRGKGVFERRFRRSEGHGPDFNTTSCRACHEIPVTGGSAPLYRNFFLGQNSSPTGAAVNAFEGNQIVARTFSHTRPARETIPPGTLVVAQRNAPPIFGLGKLEAIPEVDIEANADPFDIDGDGISGVMNFEAGVLARFGYKAQSASLVAFVRGPLFNQMGITTDPLPPRLAGLSAIAQAGAVDAPTRDNDGVPDPELPELNLSDLVTFVRQLAPPSPLPMDAEALRGEGLFTTLGCAKCHIPNLVRSGAPVFAFTDLLLHDMGPDLADGIRQAGAGGRDFRTQPLWGVRHTAPFLHDGRADTLEEAILAHGGEALAIRDAFANAPGADRAAVVRFLETR